MKYIKIYEKNKNNFKIGDYVIADKYYCENDKNDTVKIFLKNNIGIISDISMKSHDVNYINIPSKIKKLIDDRTTIRNVIIFYTDDLRLATDEEIERYKLQKEIIKYNL